MPPVNLSFVFSFLSLLPLAFPFASAACNQSCGSTPVPYPFGFSADCNIRLNCSATNASSGEPQILIDKFLVLNITSDSILIDVPPDCDRPVARAQAFFGANYAMTWNNSLLLRQCAASKVSRCLIPTDLLAQRFDLGGCLHKNDNISCYPAVHSEGFVTPGYVEESGCQLLFSSVAYASDKPSLDFRTVELGWWLEGDCTRCSPNASCNNLTSPVTRRQAVTCSCPDGFEGDGFSEGRGCQEVSSSCSASKFMSGTCTGTKIGILFAGILAGVGIMCILALACCFLRRRSTFLRSRKSTQRLLSDASCTVPFYPYKEIEKATNGFSDKNRLGTGAYGTVYAGKIHSDKLVAVKRIRQRDTDGVEQVMNEIKLLSSVSHPNLVRLLGCCIEKGEQILVYEFMPNGTLSQHLQRERGPGLPWTVRLKIATETAKAIAHLHSSIHPPIYHRDIKSSNILLDYNFNSKVADFGLSRMIMTESSHISTAPQGTPGYLDPQYHQNFHLSDKSDVYSFGVVLVEIITAKKVVDFNRGQNEVNLAALAIEKIGKGHIEDIIDPFLEPTRDAWTLSSIHKVAELAFRCLAFHKDMRPSMMEVSDELEQVILGGWAPAEDNVFMSSASSLCSSPSNGTEKSKGTSKSRRLVSIIKMEEVKVISPVSVQDVWFSEQSSPSANSLLGKLKR